MASPRGPSAHPHIRLLDETLELLLLSLPPRDAHRVMASPAPATRFSAAQDTHPVARYLAECVAARSRKRRRVSPPRRDEGSAGGARAVASVASGSEERWEGQGLMRSRAVVEEKVEERDECDGNVRRKRIVSSSVSDGSEGSRDAESVSPRRPGLIKRRMKPDEKDRRG